MSLEAEFMGEKHATCSPKSAIPAQSAIRLPLGHLKATPNALEFMRKAGINPALLLQRHHTGDWGDLCQEDWLTNDGNLRTGGRIVSCYRIGQHDALWIITECDRSVTTILLPDDY